MRWPPFLVAALVALPLAGCGTGGAKHDVRDVTQRFYAAFEAKQGERACALLTARARSELADREKSPCPEAIVDLDLQGGRPASTRVYIDQAQVQLEGGDTVFLADGPEGWRVAAAGCRPTAADRPHDCEVES